MFSQPSFNAQLMLAGKKNFRYEWIWIKPQGTGHLNAKKMPMKAHENILIFYDKLPVYNPQFTMGKPYTVTSSTNSSNYGRQNEGTTTISDGRRYPKDVLSITPEHGLHPTQKPVALCEYLIKTYTNEGNIVLDNCMGSGTTGVACINTNRKFIGIELDKGYYDIACKRIKEAEESVIKNAQDI